jgi:hypothetical protein
MPKGGRKGGTIFPRVALSDALVYAKKLVSKTHTGPQPKEVILSGVVGAKSGKGEVRMSALKQYGFLKGDAKTGYSAEELAKKITAAPPDEVSALYQRAILHPTVFKKLFDTYHGDSIPKAKLKQRAADLKVHPDETETCADLYVSGMVTAGLVTVDGDRIVHKASSEVGHANAHAGEAQQAPGSPEFPSDEDPPGNSAPETADTAASEERTDEGHANGVSRTNPHGPRAVFNVNVTLDSSLDIEKLQKQLELLKRFGAI